MHPYTYVINKVNIYIFESRTSRQVENKLVTMSS